MDGFADNDCSLNQENNNMHPSVLKTASFAIIVSLLLVSAATPGDRFFRRSQEPRQPAASPVQLVSTPAPMKLTYPATS